MKNTYKNKNDKKEGLWPLVIVFLILISISICALWYGFSHPMEKVEKREVIY